MSAPKILIIEDDLNIQELLKLELEEEGYTVITAIDGNEGITKAKEEKPDLITLDMHMEPVDGELVFYTLRRNETTCKIPIVLVSVYEKDKDEIKIEAEGYIKKPFTSNEFKNIINKVLKENNAKN